MGAHGGPCSAYGGFFVEQWCYHKAPMSPHGPQGRLMPPPKPQDFFGGVALKGGHGATWEAMGGHRVRMWWLLC